MRQEYAYKPGIRPLLAPWVGGKSALAKTIIARIPPHRLYAEPFCGAAWVLFRKSPSHVEVLNDKNGELVNLYSVVKRRLPEFLEMFDLVLSSHAEFERLKALNPAELSDLERAFRFYYLQQSSFAGAVDHFSYARPNVKRRFLAIDRIPRRLRAAWERLKNVAVENLDFEVFIRRYDSPQSFFYVDPPYCGKENYYGKGLFSGADLERLAACLKEIRGKFLLSVNDCPRARQLFGDWHLETASLRYTICKGDNAVAGHELLAANYDTEAARDALV